MTENINIGASSATVTFPDLIINAVTTVAGGAQQGFENVVFNPRQLIQQTNTFSSLPEAKKLTEAIAFRNKYTRVISENYSFPFCSSLINAVPTPWGLYQTTIYNEASGMYVYNISRIPEFVGKQYLYFKLPSVDLSVLPKTITDINEPTIEVPSNRFLGAWHNDLVTKIIKNVIIRNRSSSFEIFSYSGVDIWLHNMIFNGSKSKMQEMLTGQDSFELVYDPFDFSNIINPYYQNNSKLVINNVSVNDEFKYVYGQYYENPVMRNIAKTGHSIHERRVKHEAYMLSIPLDILPIGSTLQNSIPTAALGNESGFITIEIFDDWFNRAFYLVNTAVSGAKLDPSHTLSDDYTTYSGNLDVYNAVLPKMTTGTALDISSSIQTNDKADKVGAVALTGLSLLYDNAGKTVTNGTANLSLPVTIDSTYAPFEAEKFSAQQIKIASKYDSTSTSTGNVVMPGARTVDNGYMIHETNDTLIQDRSRLLEDDPVQTRVTAPQSSHVPADIMRNLSRGVYAVPPGPSDTCWNGNWYIYAPRDLKSKTGPVNFYDNYKSKYSIALLQAGYYMLQQIKDILTKYPAIFITTTWNTQEVDVERINEFKISNDAYIQAIAFTFVAQEKGQDYMRVYPHQLVNPELPMLSKMSLYTDTQQGSTISDWTILNKINPYHGGISPLPQNVGIFTFPPVLTEANFPLAFYDMNIYGALTVKIYSSDSEKYVYYDKLGTQVTKASNLKRGKLLVTSIGSNGIVILNLALNRLVF